jgi:two-component system phosphate regulon response regulator PhoB
VTSQHLLIIEDENEIRELIQIILKRQGFQVTALTSVEEFHAHLAAKPGENYDLIILDWMLPGQSGCDFLKDLRKNSSWKNIPIIMVTAKAEPNEVVLGLESGADDYLVKPFDGSVLLARVKALLRRLSPDVKATQLQWDGLQINLESYEAFLQGEKLPLTPTEYKLLVVMVQHHGKVFTREQLVQVVQGEGVNVIGRTIDTHVFSLRKKLGAFGDKIETARGIGYRFRDSEGQV